jgi:hypothetical protein
VQRPILLQERRGGFARVRLEVEEAPPHRVLLFQIGPVPPPVEFLSGSEREARLRPVAATPAPDASRTFSGGEDLAYTLQAHKRALVIGEVTGGGAHPVEPHVVTPHLFVMVPWGETINPITGTNWEGIGVQPNVAVPAERALERALELARKQLAERKNLMHVK